VGVGGHSRTIVTFRGATFTVLRHLRRSEWPLAGGVVSCTQDV